MQLRRATEIVNSNDQNILVYYNDKPVHLISVDNNIGTAYVETAHDNVKFEVNLESLSERK